MNTVTLKAGDKVLVGLRDHRVTSERAQAIKDRLEFRFPGVEFTLVAGVSALAVQNAQDVTS